LEKRTGLPGRKTTLMQADEFCKSGADRRGRNAVQTSPGKEDLTSVRCRGRVGGNRKGKSFIKAAGRKEKGGNLGASRKR